MRALEMEGRHREEKGEEDVGSRSRATEKQSSRARHWRGWLEMGCERAQAWRKRPQGEARSVAATCRGVVWPWRRLAASAKDWLTMIDASGVRVC